MLNKNADIEWPLFLGDAKKGGESNLDNFLVNQTIQSQFRLK